MSEQRRRGGASGGGLALAIAAVGALAGAAAVEHAQARSEGRRSLAESAWRWLSEDVLGLEEPRGGGQRRGRAHRLSSAEVAALPTRTYGGSAESSGGEKNFCAVCQEAFKEQERLLRLPCLHEYHYMCLDDYLCTADRPLCPVCRHPVSVTELASRN